MCDTEGRARDHLSKSDLQKIMGVSMMYISILTEAVCYHNKAIPCRL